MLKTMLFVYRMAGSKKMTFKVISSYLIFLTCTDAYMKMFSVCMFVYYYAPSHNGMSTRKP